MGRKPSVDLLGQLKGVVEDFMQDGVILDTPVKKRIRVDLSEERLEIIKELLSLIMLTSYTTQETKKYLSEYYITYKGVASELELEDGKKRVVSTIQSKIAYDKSKISKDIGVNIITDVIDYSNRDISGYLSRIKRVKERTSNNSVLNYVGLKFDSDIAYVKGISDDLFEEAIDKLELYSKEYMSQISKELVESGLIGYIKYIESYNDISDIDIQRLNEIKERIK